MGIPGLFAWLIRKYSKVLLNQKIINRNDILYIDANCLFHPVCNKIQNDKDYTQEKMIIGIITYIDNLIKIVDPEKYTYISVDGVPPYAKICQQRKRRFKTAYEEINKNNIKKIHNKPISTWSGIHITPGTEFMEKLHKEIEKHYKNNNKVIYSSYHFEGEGEHKIMNHIREKIENLQNNQIIIYGLDADLIVLSLGILENISANIYLLRDNPMTGESSYLNINKVLDKFNEEINRFTLIDNSLDKSYYLNDIIFISYFLGNDFLPRLPSINIKKNGGDILLEIYIECYNKHLTKLINNDGKINEKMLIEIFKSLGKRELEYFKSPEANYNRCHSNDQYEKDLWVYDNIIDNSVNKLIMSPLKIDDIKFKYYSHFFKSYEHQNETINDLCKLYIDGLVWILEYYMKGCKNWTWYYPYDHSPFVSDICNYLLRNNGYLDNIRHESTKSTDIITQLAWVIPPQYKNILKKEQIKIYNNLESVEQYPINFIIDSFDNQYMWQCTPQISLFNPK
jgi:5'-3' exonuclease